MRRLLSVLVSLSLLFGTGLQPVRAALVSTEAALAGAPLPPRVAATLQRADVQARLQQLGVSPELARQRIARLSDAELARLDQRLDRLPAGAGVIEVVGLVFIVLIILELVGVTDVFTRI